jgi:hypothetical protein
MEKNIGRKRAIKELTDILTGIEENRFIVTRLHKEEKQQFQTDENNHVLVIEFAEDGSCQKST